MKNSKKEIVITGKKVLIAAVLVAVVACSFMTGVGVVRGDAQMIHEGSSLAIMFSCACCALTCHDCDKKRAEKKAAKKNVAA